MNEIKVPIIMDTAFSHFCEGCTIAELTLRQAYGRYTLTCTQKRMCDKLWQEFMGRGLVQRKEKCPYKKEIEETEIEEE